MRYSPLTRMQTVGSVAAFGGFYYRLACTRNHAFNFYGGGRLFLGVDYTENSNPVEEIVVGGSNSNVQVSDLEVSPGVTKFMIGVDPGHVAEFFFIRKVAFVAFVSVPIKFMTQQQYLSGRAGLGLRFNF